MVQLARAALLHHGLLRPCRGAPEPLQFGAAILLAAVLYTWIYNHTGRSILAAVLFHLSGNVSGELLDAAPVVYEYETCLTALLVLVVLWLHGASTLQGREGRRRATSALDPDRR